jgi:hypothetical protein
MNKDTTHTMEKVLLHQISYRSELFSKEPEFPSKVSLAENDGGGDLVLFGAVLEMIGLLPAASETLNVW